MEQETKLLDLITERPGSDERVDVHVEIPPNSGLGLSEGHKYFDMLRAMDILPFYDKHGKNLEMRYSDDTWDFSPFRTQNVDPLKLKMSFGNIPANYRDVTKCYVVYLIYCGKNKYQTIHGKVFDILKNFLVWASDNGCYTMEDIKESSLTDYVKIQEEREIGYTRIETIKRNIKSFIVFYSANFNDISYIIPKDFDKTDSRRTRAEQEAGKTPDVPAAFFNAMLNKLIGVIRDANYDIHTRSIACVYLLLTQTGLRPNEVLSLKINDLTPAFANDKGEMLYKLRYHMRKGQRGNYSEVDIYVPANPLTKEAFDTLTEIMGPFRQAQKTDYLYAGTYLNPAGKTGIPVSVFESLVPAFFAGLDSHELNTIDLEGEQNRVLRRKEIKVLGENATLYFPTAPMLRVHLCTALRDDGWPMDLVERWLGHISDIMGDYYNRKEVIPIPEEPEYYYDTIHNIVTEDTKILGGSKISAEAVGNLIREKVEKFISDGTPNVRINYETMYEELAEEFIIRPKPFGCCITSTGHSCGEDDFRTDDLICYNGMCPNEYHFYYHLAPNWNQFKKRVTVLDRCLSRGLYTEADRNLKLINRLVVRRMIDEKAEMDRMIDKYGIEAVIERHPQLVDVWNDYEQIGKELEAWKDMNLETYVIRYLESGGILPDEE